MTARETLLADLSAAHPVLTEMINGQTVNMTAEARAATLDRWAESAFEAATLPADPIAAGYLVAPEGFTLALGDTDRAAFTAMLTLVQEALSLSVITNETEQTIADKDGTPHTVSTLRLRQILVGYGFHYKTLWDAARASAS